MCTILIGLIQVKHTSYALPMTVSKGKYEVDVKIWGTSAAL